MVFEEIKKVISEAFSEEIVTFSEEGLQPAILVDPRSIVRVCEFLFTDSRLYFDFLACLTGIDNGPVKGTMEVVYHLVSIPYGHKLVIKTTLDRLPTDASLPTIPSVSEIWKTADWHEREAYDLLGIYFSGHPDLRRILLPEDWEGHPLRKDYQAQDKYHGISVRYEDGNKLS